MTFSSSDFSDGLQNTLVELGLMVPDDTLDDDPEGQFDVVDALVRRLVLQAAKLGVLVDQASAPGGISQHEFLRAGGWRERALAALERGPLDRDTRLHVLGLLGDRADTPDPA